MRKEFITVPLALFAIKTLTTAAFTKDVRIEIGKRDHWTCQGLDEDCDLGLNGEPASWDDGFWMNAAHDDHNRDSGFYNEPHNGRILCSTHHAIEHFLKGETREAKSILSHGVYNIHHIKETGQQTIIDIEDLQDIIDEEFDRKKVLEEKALETQRRLQEVREHLRKINPLRQKRRNRV